MKHSSNISYLDEIDILQPGDKFITSNVDGTFLIDYENVLVEPENISFIDDVADSLTLSVDVSSYSTTQIGVLSTASFSSQISKSVAVLYSQTALSSVGTTDTSSYSETMLSQGVVSGKDNVLAINGALVNQIAEVGSTNTIVECDSINVIISDYAIVVDKGTYKVKAFANLTSTNITSDRSIWAYLSLYQNTPPKKELLTGSSAYTIGNIGQSLNLHLNGFIYVDQKTDLSLIAHVEGHLWPGAPTSYITENSLKKSLYQFFKLKKYNTVQLVLERISSANVLNPTAAYVLTTDQYIQPITPRYSYITMYRSGWLSGPGLSATACDIISPPVIDDPTYGIIGSMRAYVSTPPHNIDGTSTDGGLRLGSTVKYRSQIPDENGVVPTNNETYNITSSGFFTLAPGWYGMVVSDDPYATTHDFKFKVDSDGVIVERYNCGTGLGLSY